MVHSESDRHGRQRLSGGMGPREPGPNKEAARIVSATTGRTDQPLTEVDAAWRAWSAGIQYIDERARSRALEAAACHHRAQGGRGAAVAAQRLVRREGSGRLRPFRQILGRHIAPVPDPLHVVHREDASLEHAQAHEDVIPHVLCDQLDHDA